MFCFMLRQNSTGAEATRLSFTLHILFLTCAGPAQHHCRGFFAA